MDIRIKQTDYKMTSAVSDYLDVKIRGFEKMLGEDAQRTRCEVEIGRAAGRHKRSEYQWFAEIQIMRPGSERIVARNNESTINSAIDRAKEEMMVQLRKQKTKRRRGVRKAAASAKKASRS